MAKKRKIGTVDDLNEHECRALLKRVQYIIRRAEVGGSMTDAVDSIFSDMFDAGLAIDDLYECCSCDAEITKEEYDDGCQCSRCAIGEESEEEPES